MLSLRRRVYPEDLSEIRHAYTLDDGTPQIRRIPVTRPVDWLVTGWRDLRKAPAALLHGIVAAGVAAALGAFAWVQPWLGFVALTGLFLVAPVLAVGVNHMAHRLNRGEHVGLRSGFGFRRAIRGPVLEFAGLLATLFIVWASFVWLWIGVLNVGNANILGPLHEMLPALLSTAEGAASLAGVLVAGAAFALLVFGLSLVTIPALMDRHITLLDAIGISIKAFRHNVGPLLLWGALITGLTLASMATAFLALVAVFPWLGFAIWHGYRDLVEPPQEAAPTT